MRDGARAPTLSCDARLPRSELTEVVNTVVVVMERIVGASHPVGADLEDAKVDPNRLECGVEGTGGVEVPASLLPVMRVIDGKCPCYDQFKCQTSNANPTSLTPYVRCLSRH